MTDIERQANDLIAAAKAKGPVLTANIMLDYLQLPGSVARNIANAVLPELNTGCLSNDFRLEFMSRIRYDDVHVQHVQKLLAVPREELQLMSVLDMKRLIGNAPMPTLEEVLRPYEPASKRVTRTEDHKVAMLVGRFEWAMQQEMNAQDRTWGPALDAPHSWAEWAIILGSEVGEAATELRNLTWLNGRDELQVLVNLRWELIQVAAVAAQITKVVDHAILENVRAKGIEPQCQSRD